MTRVACALVMLVAVAAAEDVLVRVTFGDDPIDGAGVAVLKPDEGIVFDSVAWTPAALTDATGQAVVNVPKNGRVLVVMPGYALEVAPGAGPTIDIALRPEHTFTGTVADAQGKPVGTAQVYLRTTHNREATFKARTNAKGRFVVFGLWFDDYEVAIEAEGFLPVQGAAHGEYRLQRPATVRGRAVDKDEKPVAGVTIKVKDKRIVTADDGGFELTGLEPGDADLEISAPFLPDGRELVLPDGGAVEVELLLERPAHVSWKSKLPLTARYEGREFKKGTTHIDIRPGYRGTLVLGAEGHEDSEFEIGRLASGATHDLGEVELEPTAMVEVVVRLPDGTLVAVGKVGDVALKEGAAKVPQGLHRVEVEGYVWDAVRAVPPGPVFVTLAEPHWLTGVVVGPDGPIAGAQVQARQRETNTDAEGRFRIGPFDPSSEVKLAVAHPPLPPTELLTAMGEGDVVVRLREDRAVLVRGAVYEGTRPVRRFMVENERFVDEEGRFEVLTTGRSIFVTVDDLSLNVPLPPDGEDLRVQLPQGRATVTLAGGTRGREVKLWRPTGWHESSAETADDGIARFARLRPGVYTAVAEGFGPAEVRVTTEEPALVVLQPVSAGVLRVRFPGREEVTLADPRTRIAFAKHGAISIEAHVDAGDEQFVDLAPTDVGRLVVRGAPDWSLRRQFEGAVVVYRAGEIFPAGTYELRSGLLRREVEVVAGELVEVDLRENDGHIVTGRVTFADGGPAHGAVVVLDYVRRPVDPKGGFEIGGVPEGEYECTARLEGFVSPVARIVVTPDGVEAEGFPLVLRPPSGARIHLTGLMGEPLEGVLVSLDGRRVRSNELGEIELPAAEATLDLDLPGFASVRGRRVRDRETIQLGRGASLVVLFDVPRERLEIRIDGEVWERSESRRQAPGRLVLTDLPPGEVEVEVLPDPDAEPVEDEELEEEPEPDISRIRLRSGVESTLDVRG